VDADRQFREVALAGTKIAPWDSGAAVAELQELLCAHGFALPINSTYDWQTEAAVRSFQRQQSLAVDGVVGPETWAALKSTLVAGTRVLRFGHTGSDVRELQGLLLIHGYALVRDGVFGDRTRTAVRTFQKRHRLRATGMVDLITWNFLRGGTQLPARPTRHRWFFDANRWW
jgi:peptidoglycan hydrolase-like protein with peptidoglycan-binding domain